MDRLLDLDHILTKNSIGLLAGLSETFSFVVTLPFGYSLSASIPYISFVAIDVLVFITAFLTMFSYSFYSKRAPGLGRLEGTISHAITMVSFVLALLSVLAIASLLSPDSPISLGQELHFFSGLYTVTLSKQILKTFIIGLWLVWLAFFTNQRLSGFEDSVMLAVIALALAVSLVSINHFILLFLSLEGLSLTLYVMAAIGKQVGGTTAATQYFIFGSLGSILLLLGLVILYERFGVMSISSWLLATSSGSQTGTLFIPYAMGSGLISSGLLLKFGAAPLHSWVVEVYGNLPYYLMWFYSVLIKLAIGVVLFRVMCALPSFGVVETFSLCSIVVGCLGGLRQTEVKRLFAYGSVMHGGFLLVSDVLSFQIYLITYVLSMAVVGLVLTSARVNGQEVVYVSDLSRGVGALPAVFVLAFFIAMLSVSGIPPLAGFWGKYNVLLSLFTASGSGSNFVMLAIIVAVAATMFAFFYYFRLLAWICLDQASGASAVASRAVPISFIVPAFLIFSIFGFGFLLQWFGGSLFGIW